MLTLDTRSGERSCRLPIAAFAAATLLAVAACGGTRGGQVGSDRGGFGTGGKVLTDVGARAADALQASWKNGANAVAIQDDGRIVAAGEGDGVFALTRYMPDGRLDASFGTGGKILTDFGRKVRGSGANDAAI